MRLGELKIGTEYAVDRLGRGGHYVSDVVHARLIDIVLEDGGKYYSKAQRQMVPTKVRKPVFVALQGFLSLSGPYHDIDERVDPGERFQTPAAAVRCTWERHLQDTVAQREREERRKLVRDEILKALGALGLHPGRYMTAPNTIEAAEVMLGGAELVKLAARAESLIELERKVHEWWTGPDISADIMELDVWAVRHDFSMLESSGIH